MSDRVRFESRSGAEDRREALAVSLAREYEQREDDIEANHVKGPAYKPFLYDVGGKLIDLGAIHPAGTALESFGEAAEFATNAEDPSRPLSDSLNPFLRTVRSAIDPEYGGPLDEIAFNAKTGLLPGGWILFPNRDSKIYGPQGRLDILRRKATRGLWPEEYDQAKLLREFLKSHDLSAEESVNYEIDQLQDAAERLGIEVPPKWRDAYLLQAEVDAALETDREYQRLHDIDDPTSEERLQRAQRRAYLAVLAWGRYLHRDTSQLAGRFLNATSEQGIESYLSELKHSDALPFYVNGLSWEAWRGQVLDRAAGLGLIWGPMP